MKYIELTTEGNHKILVNIEQIIYVHPKMGRLTLSGPMVEFGAEISLMDEKIEVLEAYELVKLMIESDDVVVLTAEYIREGYGNASNNMS